MPYLINKCNEIYTYSNNFQEQKESYAVSTRYKPQECLQQLNSTQRLKLEYVEEDERYKITVEHCLYFS